MATKKDYYEVLGVPKTASDDEIKKAWRDFAKKHHPDRGGNADIFKEGQAAYEVLSDPDKKRQYDSPASNPFDGFNFNNSGRPNVHDIINDFMFGGGSPRRKPANNVLRVAFRASIEDIYKGVQTGITYNRTRIKGDVVNCASCNGQGYHDETLNMGLGRMGVSRTVCPVCGGNGKYYPSEEESITQTVIIPRGFPDNATIVFEGLGNEITPNQFGEMHLIVQTADSDEYAREGQDLIKGCRVPFTKLILGGELVIDVFGTKYKVQLKKGVDALQPMRMRGKGFQFENTQAGDLFLHVIPDVPTTLTNKEKKLLEELGKQEHFTM